MRRLIPFEEWNKLKENIAFDGTKTEIGGALEVDGEAKINYIQSNVVGFPLEGEQGTLSDEMYQALALYNTNYIENDNELYHLAHTAEQGVIVYSHISQDSQQAWNVKAITINENNKSWVKTTQAIGGGGGKKYLHCITFYFQQSSDYYYVDLFIEKNDNTPMTADSLKTYLTKWELDASSYPTGCECYVHHAGSSVSEEYSIYNKIMYNITNNVYYVSRQPHIYKSFAPTLLKEFNDQVVEL